MQRSSAWRGFCGVLALLAASFAFAAGPDQVRPASSIQVLSATYGGLPDHLRCSALIFVRQHCEGRSECSVAAGPGVCGGTLREEVPLFATLYVTYTCGSSGSQRLVKAERPFRLALSCAAQLQ